MKTNIVLLGASTGGPGHLKRILSALPSSFHASVIVAQHMNAAFIPSFISQFQSELTLPVSSVQHAMELQAGSIYFCPQNSRISKRDFALAVEPYTKEETPYNPSVDTLFLSMVPYVKECNVLAALLTGIGHDGAEGLSQLQKAGAQCMAESEKSAIVFGMPKRAVEINPLIPFLSLDEIIQTIIAFREC